MMRSVFAAAILATFAGLSPAAATMSAPSGYGNSQLIWDDTFASLDTTKWNTFLGTTQFGRFANRGLLPSPFSGYNKPNFDDAYYAPSQVSTGGGGLVLTAVPDATFSSQGYTWVSGVVSTAKKWSTPVTGCYIQWRAKQGGAWPALWFPPEANTAEIDTQEGGFLDGAVPPSQVTSSDIHTGANVQKLTDAGVDLSADWHVYGVEYLPGQSVKMYFDGVLYSTFTNSVPTGQYSILIQLQVANSTASGFHTVDTGGSSYTYSISEMQVYSVSRAWLLAH